MSGRGGLPSHAGAAAHTSSVEARGGTYLDSARRLADAWSSVVLWREAAVPTPPLVRGARDAPPGRPGGEAPHVTTQRCLRRLPSPEGGHSSLRGPAGATERYFSVLSGGMVA